MHPLTITETTTMIETITMIGTITMTGIMEECFQRILDVAETKVVTMHDSIMNLWMKTLK